MKLNTGKSKYIVFTRRNEDFATRVTLENTLLEALCDETTGGLD